MNVGALRQRGITLHILVSYIICCSLLSFLIFPVILCILLSQLHTEREAITDAPAIYFVRPTEKNLKRIAADCAKQVIAIIVGSRIFPFDVSN